MSVSMDNQQNIAKLKNIPDCDILVLPEMWNCPYHNDALKTAYLRHDESLMALKKLAKSQRIWIVAGSICADKYNRCYILNSDGDIVCSYDKTHLFEFHNKQDYCENEVFVPGNHVLIRHGENVAFYYVTTFAFQKFPEFYLKMEHKFYFVQPPLMSRLQRNIGSYLLKHAP